MQEYGPAVEKHKSPLITATKQRTFAIRLVPVKNSVVSGAAASTSLSLRWAGMASYGAAVAGEARHRARAARVHVQTEARMFKMKRGYCPEMAETAEVA